MNNTKLLVLVFLGLVTMMTGLFVAYDVISNNRVGQLFIEKKMSNWNWNDKWKEGEKVPVSEQLVANSYNEAIEMSGELGKPVFVFFEADWCNWCKKMKKDVLSQQKVKVAMLPYILVFVDTDKHRDISKKYDVQYLPAYSITNHFEANLKSGSKYRNTDEFVSWLNNPRLYKQPKKEEDLEFEINPPRLEPEPISPPEREERWQPFRPYRRS